MVYRTDRKSELQRNLERFAEEEAELEQLALDLDAYSKYQKAEVRLRTKGLKLIEQEDYEEAKKYVDNLLKQTAEAVAERKQKRKKAVTIMAVIAGIGLAAVVGYKVAEPWWNSADYALQALAKYDTPAKYYSNLEVREKIISELDEIFEEHALDEVSDEAASKYLMDLEKKGYSVKEGAIALNTLGLKFSYNSAYDAYDLESDTIDYLDFLTNTKLDVAKQECLLNLVTHLKYGSDQRGPSLDDYLKELHNEGYCKE